VGQIVNLRRIVNPPAGAVERAPRVAFQQANSAARSPIVFRGLPAGIR